MKQANRGNQVAFEIETDWETKMEFEEYITRNLGVPFIEFEQADNNKKIELLDAFIEFPMQNEEDYFREADRFIAKELIPYLMVPATRKNPINSGNDSNGPYFQYGSQKRYYYDETNERSRTMAYNKAKKQASAIFASGYQPKGNPRMPLDGMETRRNPIRRNSAGNNFKFQEIKDGVITGFDEKITFVDDGKGNELEFDIDDIEAVSTTPIDDMEKDASCKLTYRPMISSDGEFHGNYLKTFDWWYE